jgi:hypothetical protein
MWTEIIQEITVFDLLSHAHTTLSEIQTLVHTHHDAGARDVQLLSASLVKNFSLLSLRFADLAL